MQEQVQAPGQEPRSSQTKERKKRLKKGVDYFYLYRYRCCPDYSHPHHTIYTGNSTC